VDEDRDYKTKGTVHQEGGRGCIEEMLERNVIGKDTALDSTHYEAYSSCDTAKWR
jgi:hypothetical protein